MLLYRPRFRHRERAVKPPNLSEAESMAPGTGSAGANLQTTDVSIDEMIRVVTASGHSRLPVYDDDLENIIGIVHVKDVLAGITGEKPVSSIRELTRPPFFIPQASHSLRLHMASIR